IDDVEIQTQKDKLIAQSEKATVSDSANASKPVGRGLKPEYKPEINFEDFSKIELRTGTIIEASKVEKADKLLKLKVDLGNESRTILSGIALHFQPEQILGKQVVVVVNLASRKMRGIESQGMILMATSADNQLIFVSPEMAVNNGTVIS